MIHAVVHHPASFAARSGLLPLVEAVGARAVFYDPLWEQVEKRSWTLGSRLRGWGIHHYGSTWNALVPYLDEWRLARRAPADSGDVVHFLWAEYASPLHPSWFSRRGAKIAGTFHCSARRMPQVLGAYKCLSSFDRISVMSKSQIPWLVAQGYPADRISVTMHGVDVGQFRPPSEPRDSQGPLRLLIAGYTERDHEFAAQVMRSLSDEAVQLDVASSAASARFYDGLANVRLLPRLSDMELIEAYRNADLLFIPLLDCTANNAVLEAMACGTPVMVNDVGGIREYADNGINFILSAKDVGLWRERLMALVSDRQLLLAARGPTRAWAEKFSWQAVASQYHEFYRLMLSA